MLLGPYCLDALARDDVAYSSIDAASWGLAGNTIDYGYDANGALTTKDTSRADGTSQSVVNTALPNNA